jgi:hypothetical protein
MATENILELLSREAGANVTNKRFHKEVAGGKVDRCSVQGERPNGVIADRSRPLNASDQAIAAGNEAPLAKKGTVIVESGGTVADGAEVMTDTVGRAITFAVAAGQYAAGKVVNGSSSSAAGQDLSIELYDYGMHL